MQFIFLFHKHIKTCVTLVVFVLSLSLVTSKAVAQYSIPSGPSLQLIIYPNNSNHIAQQTGLMYSRCAEREWLCITTIENFVPIFPSDPTGIIRVYVSTSGGNIDCQSFPELCNPDNECETQTGNPIVLSSGRKYLNETDVNQRVNNGVSFARNFEYRPETVVQSYRDNWSFSRFGAFENSINAAKGRELAYGAAIAEINSRLNGNDNLSITRIDYPEDWLSIYRNGKITTTGINYKSNSQGMLDVQATYTLEFISAADSATGEAQFLMTELNGDKKYFSHISGLLEKIEWANGNSQTITRTLNAHGTFDQSISDSYGDTISFNYITADYAILTDQNGDQYHYLFDPDTVANPKLKIIYPDNTPATLDDNDYREYEHISAYDTDGNPLPLNGALQAVYQNGELQMSYQYDPVTAMPIHETGPNGINSNTINYTLNTDNKVTQATLTNALGKDTVYTFETLAGRQLVTQVDGLATANCAPSNSSMTYDDKGYKATETDRNGNITHYTYDENGKQIQIQEAVGTDDARTTSTEYHPQWQKPIRIVEPGLITEMTYDTKGNVQTETRIDNTTTACIADNTLPACRQLTSYTYNDNNQILTIDGSRNDIQDITTYTYDTNSNRNSITNALGQIIQLLDHNGRGQPQRMIDPNGIVTELSYHPRGWLLSTTIKHPTDNSQDATTAYDYNSFGNLTKITQPNGVEINYHYDTVQRLIGISNNNNERIDYTLDNAGNQIAEVIRDGSNNISYQQTSAYDELSRIIETIGGEGQTSTMAYDLNDNNINSTNPRTLTTNMAYDALNRLKQYTDPDNASTDYIYDGLDRVQTVTDANGNTTIYTYDGFGNIIEEESPDTGITTYTYDTANNRISMTDNKGIVTTYQYDALNRLTNVSYPDTTANITYSYDQGTNGIGRLTGYSDKSGTTTYSYNYLGQQIAMTTSIANQSYNTSNQYDLNGLLLEEQYPSGAIVQYQRDNLGRINQITLSNTPAGLNQIIADNIQYQAYGDISSFTYGNGLLHTRSYDQSYRLTDLTVSGTSTEASSYGSKTYSYDAVGNRTQRIFNKPDATIGTQTLSYATNSNRLTFWGAKPVSYDNNGNIINVTDPEGNDKHTWAYDDRNRMTDYWKQGVLKAKYNYNAMGQRVSKIKYKLTPEQLEEEGNTFHFHYNQSGQLQQETIYKPNTTQPKRQRHYIWLDDMPVAYLETIYKNDGSLKSETLHYLISDHLNTPRKATNQAQTITWQWHGDAFGKGGINNDPDGDTIKTTINLRFPGQYKDGESGLYYNYYRDYDPRTGRYVQSDPIGVMANYQEPSLQMAINYGAIEEKDMTNQTLNHVYGYVRNNPLLLSDISGLHHDGNGCVDGLGNRVPCPRNVCQTAECAAGILPNPPPATSEEKCIFACNLAAGIPCALALRAGWQAFLACRASAAASCYATCKDDECED